MGLKGLKVLQQNKWKLCTGDKGSLLVFLTSSCVRFLYSLHLFSQLAFSFSLHSILATGQFLSALWLRWTGEGEEKSFVNLPSSETDIEHICSRIGGAK